MNILRKLFGRKTHHDEAKTLNAIVHPVLTSPFSYGESHLLGCAYMRSVYSDKTEKCDCKERGRIYITPGYHDEF